MNENVLLSLAERCEAASGSDRKLDREIRDTLGLDAMLVPPDGGDEAFPYTASIDAALTLVPGGNSWTIFGNSGDDFEASVSEAGELAAASDHSGATPALALCAAALRAKAVEVRDLAEGGKSAS